MAISPISLSNVAAGQGGFVLNGEDANDLAGWSLAGAGDINGDGFDDFIIGARHADGVGNASGDAGASYVVFGKASGFGAAIALGGLTAAAGFVMIGQDQFDELGNSVASARDVNGDGFEDFIIGARDGDGALNAKINAGDSYVVFGKASGFGSSVDLADIAAGTGGFAIHGQDVSDYSGFSVASAGDVNGDGLDDLIIGAKGGDAANNAKASAGDSYVVFGKATGFGAGVDLAQIAAGNGGFVMFGQDSIDEAGWSVASAGDINGDGYDDLLVGAPDGGAAGNLKTLAGETYVVFGKPTGFGASIDLTNVAAGTGGFVIHGRNAYDDSGYSVASAGDINGDGFADIVIGAQGGNANGRFTGDTFVVFGKAAGFGPSVDLTDVGLGTGGFVIFGQHTYDFAGLSVASAGDVNGDGFDDLIIGAPGADSASKSYAGKSYVVFGKASGFGSSVNLATIAAGTGGFVINGPNTNGYTGYSVASAGDIDGDGFDDLMIGAPAAGTGGYAQSNTSAGDAYIVFGKDFAGTLTQAGDSGANTLTGSAAANDMVGGQGNDTLIGNGGVDVLIGGSGDDVLHVSDLTFRRVDGGSGFDTLVLDGANISLNLSSVADSKLKNIEAIDITGTGNNTLTLSALEVLNLSGTSNALTVNGNAGDTVSFGTETWANGGSSAGFTTFSSGQAKVLVADAVACFLPGTMIATTGGDIPVEHLHAGDRVLTAGGQARRLVWIGVGHVLAARGRRGPATPIIVCKGALADNVPYRDLRITKGHSLYLDGVLIPAEFLINHRTILWDDLAREVTIYHLELDAHDVLFANGAPSESYRDDGNRWMFGNANTGWGSPPLAPCAPVLTGGPVVDAVWWRLLGRIDRGPRYQTTEDADPHLRVDGKRVDGKRRDSGVYIFQLPASPREVRLVSRAGVPMELGLARDPRSLGVAVRRILVWRGAELRAFDASDPALSRGFHLFEADNGFRWTDGDAVLPAALFEGAGGRCEIEVHVACTTTYALFADPEQRAA